MKTYKYLIIFFLLFIACKEEIKTDKIIEFGNTQISNITANGAAVSSTISKTKGLEITNHGFLISINTPQNLDDKSLKLGALDPSTPTPIAFKGSFQNLSANTSYSIKPFAQTEENLFLGEMKELKTSNISQPQITTGNVSEITINSAKLEATISRAGSNPISERGLVWATSANPTTANFKSAINGNITTFPHNYSVNANTLSANTTYNYRAYVISNGVTTYGENKTFKTLDISQPQIATGNASEITINSAKLEATISRAGSNPISERGIVWATSANPTTANFKSAINGNVTTFPHNYSVNANTLSANTTYNYRAYVISNGVTTYGENKTFKTLDISQPQIATGNASEITINSAKLEATISRAGTNSIAERGIVWATSANPTTANFKSAINGNITTFPHNYSISANTLSANTTYNYRAYVISNGVTTYGENKTFKTLDIQITQPGIRTEPNPKVGDNDATLVATLISKGSHPIQEYGLVWSNNSNPTTSNNKKIFTGNVTNFPHTFNTYINNLQPGVYHFRAYVIMNGTTTYGNNQSFTVAIQEPFVETISAQAASGSAMTLTGRITSQGSYNITEMGIIYGSSSTNLSVSDSKVSKSGNGLTFPHSYSFTINGITNQNNAVYYRAYAISNGKVYYGKILLAHAITPIVEAQNYGASGVSNYSLKATITRRGTYPIKEYGFVYSNTEKNPTVNNKKLSKSVGLTLLIMPFSYSISETQNNLGGNCKTVYYRAYVLSEDNKVTYSTNTITFTTIGCVN